MQYIGDIELVGSEIINLKVDANDGLPPFTSDDESRVVYNLTDHQLYYNNGSAYFPLQVASQNAQPLIETLGNNWINPDLSFNPIPFNTLPFISGLTSTDSLFSVFEQITAELQNLGNINIDSLEGVSLESPQVNDVLYFNGTNWTNTQIDNIPNLTINISLGSLNDVELNGTMQNTQSLFFDSNINKFTNANWAYTYSNNTSQASHTVIHNLDQQFCQVTVINHLASPPQTVAVSSIQFNSAIQLTVNLVTPSPATILITCIPALG